ncbi:MAG: elongation factor 1-beta [Candidatus Thermoplasmatota archaeon]|jgi:elongation factor 1-beta|nr:elongation factor 1-beta [Candidatus Thermoplasmatota archaeon]MCL5987431.1 elongation factor 1-beta [Candidatus Thermoplasmatota archaeon]
MAEVAMTFSVLPENSEDDVDILAQDIRKVLNGKCRVVSITKKELAFGLKSLQLVVIVKDEGGQQDMVEDAVRTIKGIGQIDIEDSSLV